MWCDGATAAAAVVAGDDGVRMDGDDGGGGGADQLRALTSALTDSRVAPAYGCALRCAGGPRLPPPGPDLCLGRTRLSPRPKTRLSPRTGTRYHLHLVPRSISCCDGLKLLTA